MYLRFVIKFLYPILLTSINIAIPYNCTLDRIYELEYFHYCMHYAASETEFRE